MKEFKLPDLGEGVHEGKIVRVMVKPGDMIKEDQPLMEVETDKAAVEIPSPYTGEVQSVHVKAGQMVNVGDVMFTFGDGKKKHSGPRRTKVGEHVEAKRASASSTPQSAPPVAISSTATLTPPAGGKRKPASPAVRKLARELGVDLSAVNGSGPGGRVLREDVEQATKESPLPGREGVRGRVEPRKNDGAATHPPAPSLRGRGSSAPAPPKPVVIDIQGKDGTDQYGPITRAELSQARKTIGQVMSQSWSTIPHATDHDDADVTELDKLRKGYATPGDSKRKLTMLAFVIRAVVRALQKYPTFNASLDLEKDEIIYKRYINIAVGVHSERGLVPMVIRNTDQLSIPQISEALAGIAEKAHKASFEVNDTRGGTYTISNAGAMGGSRYSTPIITPPQVAVLALGRTKWMPWVVDGEVVPRLIMPLSHSFDHRILDGGDEIAFTQHVINDLENPARLLL